MINDLTNKVFGRLTAVAQYGKNKHNKILWECLCNCGNKSVVISSHLVSGHTKSCGCLNREINALRQLKHGLSRHPLYRTLLDMKKRCYDKGNKNYKWYGAKGVVICDKWLDSVESFIEWGLINGYKDGLTIDRKKSDESYTPDNCQFITQSENTLKMIEENYR